MLTYEMKRLSNSRTTIMGIAMLFILFFHCGIVVEDLAVLQFLKLTGDIGVDVFLFASGIGSYFALQKYTTADYYRGRLYRIVPAFMIVTLVWSVFFDVLLCSSDFFTVFKTVTGLSFWLDGKLVTWYLSSLLLLYLLTPWLLKIIYPFNKTGYVVAILMVTALALTIRLTQLNLVLGHLLVWLCRVPVYLVGLYCGDLIFHGKTIRVSIFGMIVLAISSIFVVWLAMGWGTIYIPFALKYFAYCPLAVIISGVCSYIPEKRFLQFCGSYSMELYLLHEKVLWVLDVAVRKLFPRIYAIPDRKIILNIAALIIACIGAVILKELCKRMLPGRKL